MLTLSFERHAHRLYPIVLTRELAILFLEGVPEAAVTRVPRLPQLPGFLNEVLGPTVCGGIPFSYSSRTPLEDTMYPVVSTLKTEHDT